MSLHRLIVGEWSDDQLSPEWEIQHPPKCNEDECPVTYQINEAGIDAFGITTSGSGDSWTIDPWPNHLPKTPGKYWFEYWHSKTYIWSAGAYEYDAGLTLVDAEDIDPAELQAEWPEETR